MAPHGGGGKLYQLLASLVEGNQSCLGHRRRFDEPDMMPLYRTSFYEASGFLCGSTASSASRSFRTSFDDMEDARSMAQASTQASSSQDEADAQSEIASAQASKEAAKADANQQNKSQTSGTQWVGNTSEMSQAQSYEHDEDDPNDGGPMYHRDDLRFKYKDFYPDAPYHKAIQQRRRNQADFKGAADDAAELDDADDDAESGQGEGSGRGPHKGTAAASLAITPCDGKGRIQSSSAIHGKFCWGSRACVTSLPEDWYTRTGEQCSSSKTGKDICQSSIGQPWCVRSESLAKYGGPIEIDCAASGKLAQKSGHVSGCRWLMKALPGPSYLQRIPGPIRAYRWDSPGSGWTLPGWKIPGHKADQNYALTAAQAENFVVNGDLSPRKAQPDHQLSGTHNA